MKNQRLWTIAVLAALLLSVGAPVAAQVINKDDAGAASGSLWVDGRNPFLDRTARKEGDLITILISESSIASFSASTSTAKQDSNSVTSNLLNSLFGLLSKDPVTGSNGKTSGSGTTSQNGTLRARLTAVVKSVMPNGNLVIEGTRIVTINKDSQTFRITGFVRRDDVAPDNTILSESIAQAEIAFEGKGQIADRQRKGVLTRLLDWLF